MMTAFESGRPSLLPVPSGFDSVATSGIEQTRQLAGVRPNMIKSRERLVPSRASRELRHQPFKIDRGLNASSHCRNRGFLLYIANAPVYYVVPEAS